MLPESLSVLTTGSQNWSCHSPAPQAGLSESPSLPDSHEHVPSYKSGCGLLSTCVTRAGPTDKWALWVWCVADQIEAQGRFTCASSTSPEVGIHRGGQNRALHLGRQGKKNKKQNNPKKQQKNKHGLLLPEEGCAYPHPSG